MLVLLAEFTVATPSENEYQEHFLGVKADGA